MAATKIAERRSNPRGKPSQLVYIEFGTDNGGMIKNVAEGGMRFFLMNPVIAGHKLHFGMTIDPSRRIEGEASIIWSDASGKSGGLSFAELSPKARQTLRSWLTEIEMDGALPGQPSSAVVEVPPASIPSPQAELDAAHPVEETSPPSVPASRPPVTIPPAAIPAAVRAAPAATPAPSAPASVPAAPLTHPVTHPAPPSSAVASPPIAPQPATVSGTPETAPAPVSNVSASVAEKLLPSADLPSLAYDTPRLATREEWRRAMREDSAPAEKPTPETSPEKMLAALMPLPASPAPRPAPNAVSAPPESRSDSRNVESAPPPYQPPPALPTPPSSRADAPTFANAQAFREPLSLGESFTQPNFSAPPTTGVSRSRLAMILALAAICGAAAAFAGIAYRRNVGESLIAIGEKISGDSRSGEPANVSPQNSPQDSSDPPPNVTPQEPAHSQPPQRSPLDFTPQTQASAHDTTRDSASAKPKAPPRDISSLWVAVQNGDASAELVLANRYIDGDGVVKNCDQARVLLEAAAKRGNSAAVKRLAELPSTGCP
jgi:PilZ domain